MTDDMERPADEHEEDGEVAATYLVRLTLRQTGITSPPTLAQIESAITTMVSASWHGFTVRARAERVDR